jgi:hypothetical protein
LGLHVVGEYIPEDGTATPLFGKILADDSVVQTLSGGYPSYAYGLHLDVNQLQTVFDRLHNRVPTAQLYDFLTDPGGSETQPGYSRFTFVRPGGPCPSRHGEEWPRHRSGILPSQKTRETECILSQMARSCLRTLVLYCVCLDTPWKRGATVCT